MKAGRFIGGERFRTKPKSDEETRIQRGKSGLIDLDSP
jgi:hypothetical protein